MLILLLLLVFTLVITTINVLYNKELQKNNQPPVEKTVQIGISILIILALSCATFFIVATSQPDPSDHYKPTVTDIKKAKKESKYYGKNLYIKIKQANNSDGDNVTAYAIFEENLSTKKLKQLSDFSEMNVTYTTKKEASFTEFYGLNVPTKTTIDFNKSPWLGFSTNIDTTKQPKYIYQSIPDFGKLIIPSSCKTDGFVKVSNVKLEYDPTIMISGVYITDPNLNE